MMMLRILCTPSCWTRNHPTSRALSRFINERLDAGQAPERVGRYYAILDGLQFWVENHPYASVEHNGVMADRATVFRFYDAMEDAAFPALRAQTP